MKYLNPKNHDRIFQDNKYIYPVLSRRAKGLSLGINLNTNNACNWRCIYCQVPNLIRGKPAPIDLGLLKTELDNFLDLILNGNFLQEFTPTTLRKFNDISLSGNGESTLAPEFLAVCEIILELKHKYHIDNNVKSILITNGSEILNHKVSAGISLLNNSLGEVWFKIDRGSVRGIAEVNQINLQFSQIRRNLAHAIGLCKTFIQSCWFKQNGIEPGDDEIRAFVELIEPYRDKLAGVLLYSVARAPALPEGANVSSVDAEFMLRIMDHLSSAGISGEYFL